MNIDFKNSLLIKLFSIIIIFYLLEIIKCILVWYLKHKTWYCIAMWFSLIILFIILMSSRHWKKKKSKKAFSIVIKIQKILFYLPQGSTWILINQHYKKWMDCFEYYWKKKIINNEWKLTCFVNMTNTKMTQFAMIPRHDTMKVNIIASVDIFYFLPHFASLSVCCCLLNCLLFHSSLLLIAIKMVYT